jgi:hypothetical protein
LEWVIVMLLSPVLIVGGIIAIWYAFEYPIIWFPLIPVSVVFSVFVCGRLGDMGRVRCGHRIIVEDAMEQRAQVGYKKTVSPWVEDFFLGSMERCDSRRYLLGGLYRTFGEIMSHWLLILAYIPISALVLSYTNKWIAELVFVISSVIAFKISLPVKSDILFPEGRIERYRASIAAAVGALLLLVAAAAVVTAFSWLFAMLMPDIKGHPCEAIPVRLVYLPCLLAPAFLALQLLGLKARAVGVVNAVVVIISVLFIGEVSYLNAEGCMWPGYTRAVLLSSVFVGGWIAFLLVLRRVCSKWSLVGQGRLR